MSVSIDLTCDQCHKPMRVPADAAGKRVRCPYCQAVLAVPIPVEPVEDAIQPGQPPQPPPAAIPVAASPSRRGGPDDDEFSQQGGVEVPGLMLRAPYGARERLRDAMVDWAERAGYRVSEETERGFKLTKGMGFLTAIKEFRIRFRSAAGYDYAEVAPYLRNMGCVGSIEAKFMAGIPAATARKDRDALVERCEYAVPELEKKRIPCRVSGLPLLVFMIFSIVIAIIAGILGFVLARGAFR